MCSNLRPQVNYEQDVCPFYGFSLGVSWMSTPLTRGLENKVGTLHCVIQLCHQRQQNTLSNRLQSVLDR